MHRLGLITLVMATAVVAVPLAQKPAAPETAPKPSAAASRLDALKQEAVADVESRARFSQQTYLEQLGIKCPTVRGGSSQ